MPSSADASTEALTPTDFRLPPKFKEYRENQLETAAKAAYNREYGMLIDAPTGVGKTAIGGTIQRMIGSRMVYLVTTKQLQEQILADFPYARTLKGRANYPCMLHADKFPQYNAEMCTDTQNNPCPAKAKCPYLLEKSKAEQADLAVLNVAYFLAETSFAGNSKFVGRKMLVADECDEIENQLMSFIELAITKKQLDSLGVEPPRFKTKFEAWQEWGERAYRVALEKLQIAQKNADEAWFSESFADIKRRLFLEKIVPKLGFFKSAVNEYWVWYPGDNKWVFKPVLVSKYATNALWSKAQHITGMSATILDDRQLAKDIGVDEQDRTHDYIQLDCPFPVENRPIRIEPVAEVIRNNMNIALPALTKRIQQLIDSHPDIKILIHTVTYDIAKHLMNNIHSKRLLTHATVDRAQTLETFKKSPDPLVMISPSLDRGVDLPDDQCRLIIIAKIPYPYLGDPQINKRVHAFRDGNSWYAHKTVSSIIQMAGRGVRHADDWCETVILDKKFTSLYTEHNRLFPKWFKDAIIMR